MTKHNISYGLYEKLQANYENDSGSHFPLMIRAAYSLDEDDALKRFVADLPGEIESLSQCFIPYVKFGHSFDEYKESKFNKEWSAFQTKLDPNTEALLKFVISFEGEEESEEASLSSGGESVFHKNLKQVESSQSCPGLSELIRFYHDEGESPKDGQNRLWKAFEAAETPEEIVFISWLFVDSECWKVRRTSGNPLRLHNMWVECLDKLYDRFPDDPYFHYWCARQIFYSLNDNELRKNIEYVNSAERHLKLAEEIESRGLLGAKICCMRADRFWCLDGETAQKKENNKKALEHALSAIKKAPESSYIWPYYSYALYECAEYDKVREFIYSVVSKFSSTGHAHYKELACYLALAYWKDKTLGHRRFESADIYFRDALEFMVNSNNFGAIKKWEKTRRDLLGLKSSQKLPKEEVFQVWGKAIREWKEHGGPWKRADKRISKNGITSHEITRVQLQDGTIALPVNTDALNDLFLDEGEFKSIVKWMKCKKNIILQGPPGVGKTFLAKRLANYVMGDKDDHRVAMIQFHQSYSYEDFIQGFRPNSEGKFDLKNGIFYEFCLKAQKESHNSHFFVIDEINRGNLAKIFGEALMLIESDKRGPEFSIPLTYAQTMKDTFFIPENLHIIGTMNTADRSLALVDYALRRRFSFIELEPKFESPQFIQYLKDSGVKPDLVEKIVDRMTQLNAKIAEDTKDLGPGYRIGHSYFCPTDSGSLYDEEWYTMIIKSEIKPLLQEYWFDDPQKVSNHIDHVLS